MRSIVTTWGMTLPLIVAAPAALTGCEAGAAAIERNPEELTAAIDDTEEAIADAAAVVARLEPKEAAGTLTEVEVIELRWARRDIAREQAYLARLEARRAERHAAQDEALDGAQELPGQLIGGRWFEALGTLIVTIGGAVTLLKREAKRIREEQSQERKRDREAQERELAAVQSRVDSTLEVQGLAPTTARSAQAAQSPVARAGALAQEQAAEAALERVLAKRLGLMQTTPPAAPTAPTPPAARTSGLEEAMRGLTAALAPLTDEEVRKN